jgi:hypothetical protein
MDRNRIVKEAPDGLSLRINKPLSREAIFYMVLLAFQFGLQPSLTRRFTPPTVCRSTVVFVQECLKFCLAFAMLSLSGATKSAIQGTIEFVSNLERR